MPAHRSSSPALPDLEGFQPALFITFRKKHCKGGQSDMARRLGYSPATISQIERGRIKPSRRFLELVARVFGIDTRRAFFTAWVLTWLT